MKRIQSVQVKLLLFALFCGASCASGSETVGSIVFAPCDVSAQGNQMSRRVDCATLQVPENNAVPDGRQIELFVARLKSRSNKPALDPVVMIAGGPGQAASESYLFADKAFRKLSRDRDIYLIDQRGTGRSSPLVCDAFSHFSEYSDVSPERVLASTKKCLAELEYDPRYFTTSAALKDLEFVRVALGVSRWNIMGTSYGTRVVLHYLRRYPQSIRTAVLDGVVYPELNLGPDIAFQSQRALSAVLSRCENSLACNKAFPSITEQVNNLVAELKRSSLDIEYEDFQSGSKKTVVFTLSDLAILMRMSLYQDESFSLLPAMLYEAYENNNYAPLARRVAVVKESLMGAINMAMHNAVVCSEDAPFYREEEKASDALASTYLGAEVLESILLMCSVWPQGSIDDNFKAAVETDIPVLLLSGSEDPITPPEYADIAAQTLINSKHIVLNGQGHGVTQIGCAPTLIAKFIDEANVASLQSKCTEKLESAPFFLDFNGPSP